MDSIQLKNNIQPGIGQKQHELAEKICHMLNQGGLFEIYQILENLKNDEDRKYVVQAFVSKYNFNFLNYI